MYTNLREQVGNDLEIHFSHWFQWMFFYYATSFFHNNKTNTFLFSNNSSKQNLPQKQFNYDNISHVKEAFTLESQQKKIVYVEKLKN